MGMTYNATCRNCGNTFTSRYGGGFSFVDVRCDKCGKEKTAPNKVLNMLCLVINEDKFKINEEINLEIEAAIGRCECGGRFSINAPVRCPQCKSTDIEEGPGVILYD